jgi:LDH2 family malate/lactate/ureidoglycolate dehydrogenase
MNCRCGLKNAGRRSSAITRRHWKSTVAEKTWMTKGMRIRHEALIAAIRRALEAEGVPASVSGIEAEVMAEADLMGVPSHGVRWLPGLVKAIREKRVHPDPRLSIIRERAATCVMDGDNGPGRYVATRGMEHAVERAKGYGAGVCLAAKTTHWGRAHSYACRAARSGMIGICTTNAIPNMLAWGSSRPLLGNNPIAIAVPRGPGLDPIVLDLAMSQAAVGKVGTYLREGREVPQGWGLDSAGQPTSDPAAIMASRKFLPMGEHKGAGLALMMELLTGALSGGLFSHEIERLDSSALDPNSSKLFLALDVAAFVEPQRLAARVADFLSYLHEAQEPGEPILFPGERGWQTRARNLAEGIPIHYDIVAQLRSSGIAL